MDDNKQLQESTSAGCLILLALAIALAASLVGWG